MTTEEEAAYQRLEGLQRRLERELGAASRGLRDLVNVPVSRDLLADIWSCIKSEDHLAIGSGLFVLKGLTLEKSVESLPRNFLESLVVRIAQLTEHPVGSVSFDAIDWYGQLRRFYLDYRQRMLSWLASSDAGSRELALKYFPTFAEPGEVEPLLRYRTDVYASEQSPMGDWEYVLRNRALDHIEAQLARKFPRISRSEPYMGGARVTWFDWSPFIEWWLRNGSEYEVKRRQNARPGVRP